MDNIIKFENNNFGTVRTIEVNGVPYFVGKDVAMALGYSNVRDAIAKHVDDEDKGVAKCDTLGGKQNLKNLARNPTGFRRRVVHRPVLQRPQYQSYKNTYLLL